jgi:hypothetical protein
MDNTRVAINPFSKKGKVLRFTAARQMSKIWKNPSSQKFNNAATAHCVEIAEGLAEKYAGSLRGMEKYKL